ncbi:MAG: hypothetical protein ACREO0_03500 [Pseudoxanthomonas sp.]
MNDIGTIAAGYEPFGLLAALSIQRTRPGVTPQAPSNEDRARAWRNAQPVMLANTFEWRFRSAPAGEAAAEPAQRTAPAIAARRSQRASGRAEVRSLPSLPLIRRTLRIV